MFNFSNNLADLNRKEKENNFKKLFETYYAPFVMYAKRFITELEVREDIVSSVFAKVWIKLDSSDFEMKSAVGFIKASVRNACLNYIRQQKNEYNYLQEEFLKPPIYADSPEKIYSLEELYEKFFAIFNLLPEKYRTVFIKSFFEKKSRTEIAKEMNISTKSVSRYKKETLDIFRREFREYLSLILFLVFISR